MECRSGRAHELALKLAAAVSKTDDLGYNWEVRSGRSEPLETLWPNSYPTWRMNHSLSDPSVRECPSPVHSSGQMRTFRTSAVLDKYAVSLDHADGATSIRRRGAPAHDLRSGLGRYRRTVVDSLVNRSFANGKIEA